MAESYDAASLVHYLPPEILQIIFTYLPAKILIRCREVNTMWRSVIDSMSRNDKMWRRNCKEDFAHVYEVACKKAQPGFRWFNLYRSISLWRLLKDATGMREEFCSAMSTPEIRNFKILDDGIVGVLKKGRIVYYDTKTLDLLHRPRMMGDYSKYTETENIIVVLNYNLHLFVKRKVMRHEKDSSTLSFYNAKLFTLAGEELYFVNLNDEIFVMYWRCQKLRGIIFLSSLRGNMSIGYSDENLNVLTVQRQIYSTEKENDFFRRATLSTGCNLLQQLQKYQFLENIDWRIYFLWMYMWNKAIPAGPLRDVLVLKRGGGGLDMFNRTPMRQFNFIEHNNAAAIWCPILNVDVMERKNGHTVFVAMPQKITVLKLKNKLGTKTIRKHTRPMLSEISELPEHKERDLEAAGTSGNENLHCFKNEWIEHE